MRADRLVLFVLIISSVFSITACSSVQSDKVAKVEKIQTPTSIENNSEELTKYSKEIHLDRDEKKRVNIFLSNFSECFYNHFDNNNIQERELIKFAVSHNYKNNEELFVKGDDEYTIQISKEYIERSIKKYFGISSVKHQNVDDYTTYKDGYYYIPLATGEVIPFIQINKMFDLGSNEYIAYGDVYVNANYYSGDPYDPIEYWNSEQKSEVEISGNVEAIFKEVNDVDGKRYILLKYDKKND